MSVRSFEYNSKQAFDCLYQGLSLSKNDIYYIRPNLGLAKFNSSQNDNVRTEG